MIIVINFITFNISTLFFFLICSAEIGVCLMYLYFQNNASYTDLINYIIITSSMRISDGVLLYLQYPNKHGRLHQDVDNFIYSTEFDCIKYK